MYCTESDLEQYLLSDYIIAVESNIPGIVDEHIARVNDQIDTYIGGPVIPTPALVNWVASVMVAYRVIGSLTSLMTSEAESGNEFLYIQREYERAIGVLEDIRDGVITL